MTRDLYSSTVEAAGAIAALHSDGGERDRPARSEYADLDRPVPGNPPLSGVCTDCGRSRSSRTGPCTIGCDLKAAA